MLSLTCISAAPAVHEKSASSWLSTHTTSTHTSHQYSRGSWKPLSWGNLSLQHPLQLRFINTTKWQCGTYCHWIVWWAGAQLRSKKDQTSSQRWWLWWCPLIFVNGCILWAPQVSKAPIHGKGTPSGCPVPMLFPKHLPQPMPKVAAWDTWILLCPDMTFLMQQSRQS